MSYKVYAITEYMQHGTQFILLQSCLICKINHFTSTPHPALNARKLPSTRLPKGSTLLVLIMALGLSVIGEQ
eukprot:1771742-Pleurochrysis_carterae.AAC.5